MSEPSSPKRRRQAPSSPRLTLRNAKEKINNALNRMEEGNYVPLAKLVQTIAVAIIDQYMAPFRADRNASKHPKAALEEALLGLVDGIDVCENSDGEETLDEATPP